MKRVVRLLLLATVVIAMLGASSLRTAKAIAYTDDDNLQVVSASCDSTTHTVHFSGIILGKGTGVYWEYDDFGVYPNDDDYYPPLAGVGDAGSTVSLSYTDATAFVEGAVVNFLDWDDELVLTATCAPNAFAGPAIPAGFVLRTIVCDVAVFNLASGTPLPTGERIRLGQTWYVNPKPVAVSNNAQYPKWTEIFTSGYINGFIPTACVGGKPAGYTGE